MARVIIMRPRRNYMQPGSDAKFLFELSLLVIGLGAAFMGLLCAAYLVLDAIGWL